MKRDAPCVCVRSFFDPKSKNKVQVALCVISVFDRDHAMKRREASFDARAAFCHVRASPKESGVVFDSSLACDDQWSEREGAARYRSRCWRRNPTSDVRGVGLRCLLCNVGTSQRGDLCTRCGLLSQRGPFALVEDEPPVARCGAVQFNGQS